MSAPVRPTRPAPLERLEDANTIDEVLRNIDLVIDWSISAHSTIGYFAALYKRATIAIREAVDEGKFDDCERMQRFDVLFARRYFNALNAYFHPHEYDGLMLAWEVALVGREVRRPIMVQQLMMALNAHICFDLGMAAAAVAPDSLPNLQGDFNRVNAILAGQVPGMLDVIQELSPVFRWIRRVIPNKGEVWLIRRLLFKFRAAAWAFATDMTNHPDNAVETQVDHASWTAALGAWYLQPPARWTIIPVLVRVIAKRESRNVGGNIEAFADITNKPEKTLVEAFL